jgi:hypothetical protein
MISPPKNEPLLERCQEASRPESVKYPAVAAAVLYYPPMAAIGRGKMMINHEIYPLVI